MQMAENQKVDQTHRTTLRRTHRKEQGSDGPRIWRRTGKLHTFELCLIFDQDKLYDFNKHQLILIEMEKRGFKYLKSEWSNSP